LDSTLQEIFPTEWSNDQPKKIFDLVTAEYETLSDKAKLLRAQVIEAIHGFERKPILTPADARKLLEEHHLPKYKGKWVIVAVNGKKEKIYQKLESGGMRLLSTMKEYVPKSIVAQKEVPLPKNGGYLLIYSGSTEVLNDAKALERFKDLSSKNKVLDIILWEEHDSSAVFWSVKAGTGAFGNTYKEFPDKVILEEWRNSF
jgi:hypothetical protein